MTEAINYSTWADYLQKNPYIMKDFSDSERAQQVELDIFDYIFRLIT
jgi:hypothetical protein